MLSGALLTFATIEIIFFIDVITAAIAVMILLLLLHVPVHAKALEKQAVSYFSDLGQGFTYIKNHAYIKHFFIFCAVFMVLAAPAAFLTPLQVTRSFGNDVLFIQGLFLIGTKYWLSGVSQFQNSNIT